MDERHLQPFMSAGLAAVATDSDAESTLVELKCFYEGIVTYIIRYFKK